MNRLDTLIPEYAENKSKMTELKKVCDEKNADIKSIMKDFALQHYETDEYKATYSVSEREKMNEEMLIEIAHKYNIPEIVKTKEYIDFDALEHAIYNGKISEDILLEMNNAKEVTEVVTLRVSKIKKGKSEK